MYNNIFLKPNCNGNHQTLGMLGVNRCPSGSNLGRRLLLIRSNHIGLFHFVISMGYTWQICNGNHGNVKNLNFVWNVVYIWFESWTAAFADTFEPE